ncbi:hypothetical protein CHARACLAT_026579 [Characodon lateralis]|uniref:Uncharacterized protein n=1 Tax=Characodon lateralis TaxID=208331 RepID=A0ABU7EDC5_9TELE|nr:hypothetical protein [Characodon lateralis]
MTTHLPIINISLNKNSGNRRGRLLWPVWHLLASSQNLLAPSGRLWQLWQAVTGPAGFGSTDGSSGRLSQFRWQLRQAAAVPVTVPAANSGCHCHKLSMDLLP